MKELEEDGRVVMVGASFDEIAAEAAIAVKREIDKQVEEVTPVITQALNEGTAALNQAVAAIRRYRVALFVLIFLCSVEAGCLAMLLIRR